MEARLSGLESMEPVGQYANASKIKIKRDPDELPEEANLNIIKQEAEPELEDFVPEGEENVTEENIVIRETLYVEDQGEIPDEDIKQEILEVGEYRFNDIENDSMDCGGEQKSSEEPSNNQDSELETDESNEPPVGKELVEPLAKKSKNSHSRKECEYCGKTFGFRYSLGLHRVNEHGSTETLVKRRSSASRTLPRNFHCDQCDRSYYLETNLAFHQSKVHGIGETPRKGTLPLNHTCRHCQKKLTGWLSLVNHLNFVHGEAIDKTQFVKCSSCGTKFINNEEMVGHACLKYNVREVERTFKCDLCDKAYYRKAGLLYHYSVHPEYQNVKCDECPKGFFNEFELKRHKKTGHSGKEPYIGCKICHKWFKNQASLADHQKLHSDKEYSCELCGKKFKTYQLIKSHMKHKHTNRDDEAIPCTLCGKRFKGKVGFELHMKAHNNDRRFKCSHTPCEKTFLTSSCLNKHEQTHTKNYSFKCRFCEYGAITRKRVLLHEQRHHNQDS